MLGPLKHVRLWEVSAPERTAPESEAGAQREKGSSAAAGAVLPSALVEPGARPTQRASGAAGFLTLQNRLRDASRRMREEKLEAVAEHLEVDWPWSFMMRS